MEPARSTWTDERLDDLATRIDRGFDRVDRDIRELRAETNERFQSVERHFDQLQSTIQRFGGGMILTFVAGFATLLLVHA
jgi:hypothetical protein